MNSLTTIASDAKLVRRAQARSNAAFETLVWRYQKKAFAIAHAIGVDTAEREDLVQEAFLHAFRSLAQLKEPAAFGAWFLRIVRNLARKNVTRRRRVLPIDDPGTIEEPPPNLSTYSLPEMRRELERALRSLPEATRETILLYYYEGLSSRRVARTLGVSHTAVRSRLKRGRDALRDQLWGVLEETIREQFPGTREWRRQAGRLTLLAFAASGASAGCDGTQVNGTSGLYLAAGGVVVTKKIVASAAIVGVVLALWSTLHDDSAEHEPAHAARADTQNASEGEEHLVAQQPNVVAPDSVKGVAPNNPTAEPPRAAVKGVVVNSSGEFVEGATVSFWDEIRSAEAQALVARGYHTAEARVYRAEAETDKNGRYVFAGLFPGHGYVTANAKARRLYGEGSQGVDLESGASTWEEIRLLPFSRIRGRITSSGRSVDGGAVLLRTGFIDKPDATLGDGDRVQYAAIYADAEGNYDSGFRLEVGEIRPLFNIELHGWASGFAVQSKGVTSKDFDADRVARVDFELVPEMPVTLRVISPAGEPVAEAEVSLNNETYLAGIPKPVATTDDIGVARIEHLVPNSYSFRVTKEGYRPATARVSPENSTDIPVTLTPWGEAIEAKIVFEGDLAHRRGRVKVALLSIDGDGQFIQTPGVKQRFDRENSVHTLWPPRAGRYVIESTYDGGSERSDVLDYRGDKTMALEIAVKLALRPPYVAGRAVYAADGTPAKNAVIQVHFFPANEEPTRWDSGSYLNLGEKHFFFPGLSGGNVTTKTNENGEFLLLMSVPGESTAFVNARTRMPGFAYPKGSIDVGWSQETQLTIDPNSAIDDLILEVESGRIEGQVVDASGQPMASEGVALYDGRSVLMWNKTGADGRFHFDGLRTSDYALELLGYVTKFRLSHGNWTCDPTGMPRPEEFFDRRFRVVSGATSRVTLDVSRDGLGSIEGRVDGLISQPSSTPATVEYRMLVGGKARKIISLGGTVHVVDGQFRIEGLFPGQYRLQTTADSAGGDKSATENRLDEVLVEVTRGQTSMVTLERMRHGTARRSRLNGSQSLALHGDLFDLPVLIEVNADHVVGDVSGQRKVERNRIFVVFVILIIIRDFNDSEEVENLSWLRTRSPSVL